MRKSRRHPSRELPHKAPLRSAILGWVWIVFGAHRRLPTPIGTAAAKGGRRTNFAACMRHLPASPRCRHSLAGRGWRHSLANLSFQDCLTV
jgi:hypothetical protein